MPNHLPEAKARPVYPVIFAGAGLYILIENFPVLSPILLSFFLILLLTLALNPVVVALRRLGSRRGVSTALVTILFLVLLALAAWAFYVPVQQSIGKFIQHLPEYRKRIEAPLQRLTGGQSPGFLHIDGQFFSNFSHELHALVSNTAALMVVVLTVFVGVIYMLINPRPVLTAFMGLVPETHLPKAARIADRVARFVPQWALAMVTGMGVIGAMVFFAMWAILGIQDALLLGLLAFVFEAIPYVGAFLSGIPALLMAVGQGGWTPLWVVIAYTGIQLFEHNVIATVVVAGRLRQHPVAVIFSVLFNLLLFGVLGVLLAVPMVAVVQILYEEIYRPRFLPHTTDRDLDRIAQKALGAGKNEKLDH